MAAKMATNVGDVTGLQQRHHPSNIPHPVKKVKGFPLMIQSFQNTAAYQNLWGGIHPPPPPPHPSPCITVHGGKNLRVRPRIKKQKKTEKIDFH